MESLKFRLMPRFFATLSLNGKHEWRKKWPNPVFVSFVLTVLSHLFWAKNESEPFYFTRATWNTNRTFCRKKKIIEDVRHKLYFIPFLFIQRPSFLILLVEFIAQNSWNSSWLHIKTHISAHIQFVYNFAWIDVHSFIRLLCSRYPNVYKWRNECLYMFECVHFDGM